MVLVLREVSIWRSETVYPQGLFLLEEILTQRYTSDGHCVPIAALGSNLGLLCGVFGSLWVVTGVDFCDLIAISHALSGISCF